MSAIHGEVLGMPLGLMFRHFLMIVDSPLRTPSALVKLKRRLLVPVRLIIKLERWRGNRLADWIRRRIIALQPGLESLPRSLRNRDDFILWVPPGWHLKDADYSRAKRLFEIRQVRSLAQVVSCDDWLLSRDGKRLRWREKARLDPFLDKRINFADGPLWLSKALVDCCGLPPEEPKQRPSWRAEVLKHVGFDGWAHVPLPLAVSPQPWRPPAVPGKPTRQGLVSVLIPSGGFLKIVDGRKKILLRHCLEALLQRSEYRNIEIILVHGGEFSGSQLVEYEQLVESSLGPNRWKSICDSRPYSYSLRMNLAASIAAGEYFLQLNDDTEILEPEALGSMVSLLNDMKVGVVGSLLLYPGGRVQHAGVFIDNLAPSHPWAGVWPKRLPVDLLSSPRQFQAVTAAVCMCRSETWKSLSGLREDLPVNYGDVDFCLRARQKGLMVILDPSSRWMHFESASRVLATVPAELPRFRELWSEGLGGARCIDPYNFRWRELRSSLPV